MIECLTNAGVVELVDSVDLGSSAKACRFESCRPHQIKRRGVSLSFLFGTAYGRTRTHLNATVRWTVARCGLDRIDTLICTHSRVQMQIESCHLNSLFNRRSAYLDFVGSIVARRHHHIHPSVRTGAPSPQGEGSVGKGHGLSATVGLSL